MPQLIVSRVSGGRGFLAKHHIILDGVDLGVLKNGQTLSFPINPGKHTLSFDPHSMMVETLGPFSVTVGRSDIRAVIDPGTSRWRCDITGSDNAADLDRDMAGGYAELLREAMTQLQREPKCTVFFTEKGARIGLHGYTYSYPSLSGYRIQSLQGFEQNDAANAFARYIHSTKNSERFHIYVGGRSVEISRK